VSEVSSVLGDPENPLRPEQVTDKARTLLLASGWQTETAQALVDHILAMPQSGSVGDLWAFLQMRVPAA
jgi:hypothetical protein